MYLYDLIILEFNNRMQVRVESMQMKGIYANQVSPQMAVKQEMSNKGYEKGQVIDGVVSKVSDEVSINFAGREVTFSKNTIKNAKEGEIRQFEIVDVSKRGIVLKEILNKTGNENASVSSCTMVKIDSFGRIETKEENASKEEESKDSLGASSNKLTSEDYADISKEGFTIEQFNLERLIRAIERIKEQKNFKETAVIKQTEQMKALRESVTELARAMITDTMYAEKIASKLVELDLPITKENVERMLATAELAKSANKITDASSEYLIRNELEPTSQNIYKSIHSGATQRKATSEEAWNELVGTVTEIMDEAGVTVDESSLSTARWLFDRELPITAENLKYKKFLDELKESDYLEFALQFEGLKMQGGNNIGNVLIYEENTKRAQNIVNNVNNITENGLMYACYKRKNVGQSLGIEKEKNIKELSIQEMKEAEEEYSEKTSAFDLSDAKDSVLYITAKRQLEEIRLKLTTEACHKMLQKGISVETEGLSSVVQQLKTMEEAYYSNLLKEVGASDEHLSLLKQTAESIQSLKEAPSFILGQTFETRRIQTIESLSDVGTVYKEKLQNAGESYEALMTKPRSDLGDSIAKAFNHVDEILNNLGLDTTKANQRAVRILGYNSMDITKENISAMKAYDAKVNDLFQNLTPPVTATLIKEGINPLQLSLDEVNEIAKSIIDREGPAKEESFSEYLIRLEDKKELTVDERKSYIGIYRLLHQVDKSDGAVIGSLVKAGAEVTLNNLLTAIRTKNTGSIDANIDDKFGTLASIHMNGASIREQINSSFQVSNREGGILEDEISYQTNIVSQIQKNITPDRVSESIKEFGDAFTDTSLERLKEKFDEVNIDSYRDPVIKNHMEQIQMLSKNTELEQRFLKEYDIPTTINNLVATKEMAENGASLYQKVDALMKSLAKKDPNFKAEWITNDLITGGDDINTFIESIDKPDKLASLYDSFENGTKSLLDQALLQDTLNIQDLQLVNGIRAALPLTMNLSKKEYFNIPMETNDGVIAMNLTVVHESANKGKVSINIPDKTNGSIHAELSIHNKQLKCFITAENKTVLNEIKKQEDDLNSSFKELGLTVEELYYAIKPVENSKFIFKNGSIYRTGDGSVNETTKESSDATTNDLYEAAKVVVSHIQNWIGSNSST